MGVGLGQCELLRKPLPRTWVNISGRTLAAVPSHCLAYRLLQRRGVPTECPLELGVIYHKWFLKLVEHLDYLAHFRVEKTHRPQQDLRCCLQAGRLAYLL